MTIGGLIIFALMATVWGVCALYPMIKDRCPECSKKLVHVWSHEQAGYQTFCPSCGYQERVDS